MISAYWAAAVAAAMIQTAGVGGGGRDGVFCLVCC